MLNDMLYEQQRPVAGQSAKWQHTVLARIAYGFSRRLQVGNDGRSHMAGGFSSESFTLKVKEGKHLTCEAPRYWYFRLQPNSGI